MSKKQKDTRAAIIEAACQLFSEHGYDAVTTRMITNKANVAHSAIYYHFEGKDLLYTEVFRCIFKIENALTHKILLEKEPRVLETDAGKAYAIHRIVRDYFDRNLFFLDPWKRNLILKELFNNSPIFLSLVEELMKNESERMTEFYFLLNPQGSATEAYVWAHLPDAQALYYHICWASIGEYYNDTFMNELHQRIINTTSVLMIKLLNLPVPEMLL